MFDWLRKNVTCVGEVLFRGSLPPRPEEFACLRERGLTVKRPKAKPDMQWALTLEHPEWGRAVLYCRKEDDANPPLFMIKHTGDLSDQERKEALTAGSSLVVRVPATREHALRDRKNMLRFLREIMGDDGLAAVDLLAQSVWTRQSLDEELSHDADLDIAQIYALHAVTQDEQTPDDSDEGPATCWLHTHGLGEIGFFDFDILRPSPDLNFTAADLLRAIAFAIVEGTVTSSTKRFRVANAGGTIRFVPVSEFERRADPDDVALRLHPDPHLDRNRAVLCDPPGRLLGWLLGRVRPSSFLSQDIEDELLINFSHEATQLAADRARKTYGMFRNLIAELQEIGCMPIVKLGYRVDGGEKDDKEHLWFTVHEALPGQIDASLESPPFQIERLKVGDRRMHDVQRLSDWIIMTPIGPVSPRSTRVVRFCHEHWDKLLAIGREYRKLIDERRETYRKAQ